MPILKASGRCNDIVKYLPGVGQATYALGKLSQIAGIHYLGPSTTLILGSFIGAFGALLFTVHDPLSFKEHHLQYAGHLINQFGNGNLYAAEFAVIQAWIPPSRRGVALGVFGCSASLAPGVFGAIDAAMLPPALRWQSIWWLQGGLQLLIAVVLLLFLRSPPDAAGASADSVAGAPASNNGKTDRVRDWISCLEPAAEDGVKSDSKDHFMTEPTALDTATVPEALVALFVNGKDLRAWFVLLAYIANMTVLGVSSYTVTSLVAVGYTTSSAVYVQTALAFVLAALLILLGIMRDRGQVKIVTAVAVTAIIAGSIFDIVLIVYVAGSGLRDPKAQPLLSKILPVVYALWTIVMLVTFALMVNISALRLGGRRHGATLIAISGFTGYAVSVGMDVLVGDAVNRGDYLPFLLVSTVATWVGAFAWALLVRADDEHMQAVR